MIEYMIWRVIAKLPSIINVYNYVIQSGYACLCGTISEHSRGGTDSTKPNWEFGASRDLDCDSVVPNGADRIRTRS